MHIRQKNTKFGLAAASKAQTAVSHSTLEAETVSADFAMRTIGQPALELWRVIAERDDLKITVHEDNAAMIQVMKTGKIRR